MTRSTGLVLLRCAVRVVRLLADRRLHLRDERVGTVVAVRGQVFRVFRESFCDVAGPEPEVRLLVRFHLKGTGPDHPWRSWLFERESILNTILFAGCQGFREKLWLVDRSTADYAGLYRWQGRDAAERYGAYISSVLRPLSTPGSVGWEIVGDLTVPAAPTSDLPSEPIATEASG